MTNQYERQRHLTSLMLQRRAPITQHSFYYDAGGSTRKIEFSAYRADMMGRYLSGNKILKLAPNILEYLDKPTPHQPIATFGGSHSNHLRAFSAIARMLRLNAKVFLRESPKNAHLPLAQLIKQRGLELILLSPEEYKNRENTHFIADLHSRHGNFHLISEGGTSPTSVQHIAKVFEPLRDRYSHAFVPVGLGGTLAGIAAGLGVNTKIIGVSALKSDFTLSDRVKKVLAEAKLKDPMNWSINYDYHFGGFGKAKPDLLAFGSNFTTQTDIDLYRTYTMKSAFAMASIGAKEVMQAPLWVNTFNPH